jgi:hypothetical protein
MRVHELRDAQGLVHAFEISSLMGRRMACRAAASIPGVRLTKKYKLFSFSSEDGAFCEFELNGEQYAMEEPFQDNSRYWVGPKPGSSANSLGVVLNHFANHRAGTRAVRIGVALVGATLLVAACNVYVAGSRFFQQDRCLDRGGRWNHGANACEGARGDG